MMYTIVIVKDSRKLKEARLEREGTEKNAEEENEENVNENEDCKHISVKDFSSLPTAEVKTNFQKYISVFDFKNLKESWKACLKPRPYHKRTLIWLCIGIFLVEMFVIVSCRYRVFDCEVYKNICVNCLLRGL